MNIPGKGKLDRGLRALSNILILNILIFNILMLNTLIPKYWWKCIFTLYLDNAHICGWGLLRGGYFLYFVTLFDILFVVRAPWSCFFLFFLIGWYFICGGGLLGVRDFCTSYWSIYLEIFVLFALCDWLISCLWGGGACADPERKWERQSPGGGETPAKYGHTGLFIHQQSEKYIL